MRLRILTLLALLFLNVPQAWAQKQLVDRVIAVVNDEAITQSEVDIYLRPLYEQLKQQLQGEELARQLHDAQLKLLNQIIEDRLVYQEAKARGITVDESEIDHMVEESKERFASQQDFENFFAGQESKMRDFRESLRRQIAIKKLQDMEVRSQVVVSPQEIEDYYKNRQSEFAQEESAKVRSITVRKSEEAVSKGIIDEEAKAKIGATRDRILKGENFEDLAKELSEDANAKQGGDVGWMKRGTMLPTIEEVIFQMKPGGISQVLETSVGYHLFKVEEKKTSRVPPVDEVRDKIRILLYQEEARARFNEWMNELKKNAYISVR